MAQAKATPLATLTKTANELPAKSVDMAHKMLLATAGAYGRAFDEARTGFKTARKQSAEMFETFVERGEEIEADVMKRIDSNETVTIAERQFAELVKRTNKVRNLVMKRAGDVAEDVREFAGKEAKVVKKTAKKVSKTVKGDDLTALKGVGPALEKRLHTHGIHSYAQFADLKAADVRKLDAELNLKGRIARNGWVKQAKALIKAK